MTEKPPDPPKLPKINTGSSTNDVDIKIEQKRDYQSTGVTPENVTVLTLNNNPNTSLTCYTHHLTSMNKMKRANLKKGSENLTKPKGAGGTTPIQESNVYCVHVYYFLNMPILICVAKYVSGSKEYNYYRPEGALYNPYNDVIETNWTDASINRAPNKNNDQLKIELDSLTLPLIGMLFIVMISIIIGSIIMNNNF